MMPSDSFCSRCRGVGTIVIGLWGDADGGMVIQSGGAKQLRIRALGALAYAFGQ